MSMNIDHMRVPAVLISSLLFGCGSEDVPQVCPTGVDDSVIAFNEDFESAVVDIANRRIDRIGGDTQVWNVNADLNNNTSAIVIENDAASAREGSNYVRANLKADDFVSAGNRAEISLRSREEPLCGLGYYAWSFRLDPGFTETGEFQTIGQFHAQPPEGETFDSFSGANPVYLNYVNGEVILVRRTTDGTAETVGRASVAVGQWIDVVFAVKWSLASDGYVEAWINTDMANPNYAFLSEVNSINTSNKVYGRTLVNEEGNYFKMGLYRSSSPDPTGRTDASVSFDAFRIGNSFAEVSM